MRRVLDFFKKNRLIVSRALISLLILLDLFATPVWQMKPVTLVAVESLAFIFILIATFGRLWALSYISGHKSQNLITDGPYSLTRNPLYFFSLIGAIGLAITSKSIFVFGAILLAFTFYYPLVIRAEEEHLERIHEEDFRYYKSAVPQFFPRFSGYREPPHYPVDARRMRRSFFSVMWFPLLFFIMITIDRLQAQHILHTVYTIG